MKKLIFLAAAFIPLTCMAQKQNLFISSEQDTTGRIILTPTRGQLYFSRPNPSPHFYIHHDSVRVSVLDYGTKIVIKLPGYVYTIEVDSIKSIEQNGTRKIYPFNR